MKEIYCTARFLVKKGFKYSSMNETAKENGCLHYERADEISYSGAESDCWDVCLIERWYSREDFDAHCNKSYITHFFDVIAKKYVEKADIRLYSPLSV
ncbi:protein of unknown function [Xenorhabdus poinarii G6]|uniref:ABM domain-containing protein n=1 Tax=Xenorhabdus poinarii G6 TaxID=1354304 RepID=A0A068R614_9GAMM|nr:antibiotic biosynthesis monooxygenase [Xenorhabdus poinarii]CDG22336.1 protein of unknown function [Xenorhabdus poinarii G6]